MQKLISVRGGGGLLRLDCECGWRELIFCYFSVNRAIGLERSSVQQAKMATCKPEATVRIANSDEKEENCDCRNYKGASVPKWYLPATQPAVESLCRPRCRCLPTDNWAIKYTWIGSDFSWKLIAKTNSITDKTKYPPTFVVRQLLRSLFLIRRVSLLLSCSSSLSLSLGELILVVSSRLVTTSLLI